MALELAVGRTLNALVSTGVQRAHVRAERLREVM